MRDIKLDRDGDWLVLVIARYRRDREPKISRTYLARDEAAVAIELLRAEVGTVAVRRIGA